jgi:hypothetical protein
MEATEREGAAGFDFRDVAARLPLADAALSIWRFVFDPQRLNALWNEHRGRCYEKVITFATMVHLVADALLLHRGSGRRSFEKNIASGQLSTSIAAAFGKLGRLPIAVSQALLRHGTAALRKLIPTTSLRELPAGLRGFTVIVIDGKALKKVAKRLKPLRGVGGGLLGGKVTVALEWGSGLAVAMQAHADGDASERPLLDGLLTQVYGLVSQLCLYVSDRGFCDLVRLARFTARAGDHFLVRHQSNTKFTADAERPPRTGTDAKGRAYAESWGWLGGPRSAGRRYVRRIVLSRPGEEELALVTDLLDADAVLAVDLLWLYLERWGIERLFQKVTEVFGLAGLIGSTPQACIFQFAFCMILYNIVQLLTTYVAEVKQCPPERISLEKFFDDLRDQLVAWNIVIGPEPTAVWFAECLPEEDLRERLRTLLAGTWSETWWKAKPQPNRTTTKRVGKRGHGSVFRILQSHAQAQAKAKTTAQQKTARQRC